MLIKEGPLSCARLYIKMTRESSYSIDDCVEKAREELPMT